MRRSSMPLAVEIDPKDAASWKRRVPPARFKPGQILFYRGHLPYGLLVIHSGLADLRLRATDPRKSRLRVGPNTVLGLSNLLREEPYPLSAVILEETEVSFVEKTLFSVLVSDGETVPLPH
jgi:CRP-like cAMP-binding protein